MEFIIREEQEKDVEQVRFLLQAAFSTDAESRLVDAYVQAARQSFLWLQ